MTLRWCLFGFTTLLAVATAATGCGGCDGGGSIVIGGCGAVELSSPDLAEDASSDYAQLKLPVTLSKTAVVDATSVVSAVTSIASVESIEIRIASVTVLAAQHCDDGAVHSAFATTSPIEVSQTTPTGTTLAWLNLPADYEICSTRLQWADSDSGPSFLAIGTYTNDAAFSVEAAPEDTIEMQLPKTIPVTAATEIAITINVAAWLSPLDDESITNNELFDAIEFEMLNTTLEVIHAD